ncbi:MAG: hypothetical protein L3J99_06360 [Thermoplasmata archaeon]|nr:hypothetical protein [Thermoplasmata archaeon]
MDEEMVSGPDLGAGFLYQLTRNRTGPQSTFTFHAQEGGQDASGPPIGTPEPFGWARSSVMCPFGGRKCWHRTFETPDREVGGVRAAYNRTRFVMEALLAQAYRNAPVPWAVALEEWLSRVVPVLEQDNAPWCLTHSTGSAVMAASTTVSGLSMRTTPAGVRAVASAIPEYLVEPAATTEWDGRLRFASRAFIGTLRDGVRVEWASPRDPTGSASPQIEGTIEWKGRSLPVGSVE